MDIKVVNEILLMLLTPVKAVLVHVDHLLCIECIERFHLPYRGCLSSCTIGQRGTSRTFSPFHPSSHSLLLHSLQLHGPLPDFGIRELFEALENDENAHEGEGADGEAEPSDEQTLLEMPRRPRASANNALSMQSIDEIIAENDRMLPVLTKLMETTC